MCINTSLLLSTLHIHAIIQKYFNAIFLVLKFFQPLPENNLTQEIIKECISLLCKIGDGLSHAYVKLDAKGR